MLSQTHNETKLPSDPSDMKLVATPTGRIITMAVGTSPRSRKLFDMSSSRNSLFGNIVDSLNAPRLLPTCCKEITEGLYCTEVHLYLNVHFPGNTKCHNVFYSTLMFLFKTLIYRGHLSVRGGGEWGVCQMSRLIELEGILLNVIGITRGWVGVKVAEK